MIGSAGTGADFRGLARYLLREGENGERVAWTATRNLIVGERDAAMLMDDTAAQNARVEKPVYHLSLSAAPGEELTREEWERAADRVLRDLGLEEHQALLVAHRDTGHQHLHVMVNRVHVETLKTWDNSHDSRRIEKALRHLERDWRLQEVPGRHYRLAGQERPEAGRRLSGGERREAARTGQEPWAERVRFQARKDFKQSRDWAELEERLRQKGLRLEKRGPGLVVTDGERLVKASRIDRGSSYGRLAERFGKTFEEWRRERKDLLQAAERLQKTERVSRKLHRREFCQREEVINLRASIRKSHDKGHLSRIQAREVVDRIGYAFRPEDQRQVLRRLVGVARREGWATAADRLRAEPERFGRLRGHALGPLRTEARDEALRAVRWAARDVRMMAKVRAERSRASRVRGWRSGCCRPQLVAWRGRRPASHRSPRDSRSSARCSGSRSASGSRWSSGRCRSRRRWWCGRRSKRRVGWSAGWSGSGLWRLPRPRKTLPRFPPALGRRCASPTAPTGPAAGRWRRRRKNRSSTPPLRPILA